MKGGFLSFANFHGRKDIGSSRIRSDWVVKHWPEGIGINVENFVQGHAYDFVVYQKVYWIKHAKEYKGIKILDMCDADWYDWEYSIDEMISYMDAVTTSTEALAEAIRKIIKGAVASGHMKEEIPVVWIDDRMCPEWHSVKKTEHEDKIRWVTWYGYSHNLRTIDPIVPYLKAQGYQLCVIADKAYKHADKNLPWTKESINRDIVENSDIVLNPRMDWGKWQYKSDNKTVSAWALGVPVARTLEEFESLLTKEAREQEAEKRFKEVEERYHPRLSAVQYAEIVIEAKKRQIETQGQ
jgi:hypothetical protein